MRQLPIQPAALLLLAAGISTTFTARPLAAQRTPLPVLPALPPLPQPVVQPQLLRIQIAPAPQPFSLTPAPLAIVNTGFASDENIPGPLAPVIADLHAPSPRQRDTATQKLMRLPPNRLDDIKTALAQQTDPEAIARLSNVAVHLYLKPRTIISRPSLMGVWYQQDAVSLLGITFEVQQVKLYPADAAPIPMSAVITIEPGFPVAQALLVGDRIFAINGQRFPPDFEQTTFPTMIRQFSPGSILTLSILRDGKTLDIPVQMGALPVTAADVESAVEARKIAAREFLQTLKTGRKDMPTLGSAAPLD